jgi:O-antigen/teichoic acid export membrane protein
MSALLFGVYIFFPGLTIVKRTWTFAAISISAGLLNLGLALALVPPLGIRGAGVATAASSAWFFLLTVHFSQRHYTVGHDWMRLAAALTVAIGAVVLGRAVIATGGANAVSAGPLAAKAILSLLGAGVIAMLLVSRAELILAWNRLRGVVPEAQGSVS